MGYDPGVRRPGLGMDLHRRRVHRWRRTWHLMTVRLSVGWQSPTLLLGVPRKTPGRMGAAVGRSSAGWRVRYTKRELMSRQQLLTRYARNDRVPR